MNGRGSLCDARRVHPYSSDFYICCDLTEGHEGPHLGAKDRTVEWTDDSQYAIPKAEESQ